MPTPRNQKGQKPTKKPGDTAKRLEEKSRGMGGANKLRTMSKAGQAKTKS